MTTVHTHPLALHGTAPSGFTLTHEHERGGDDHTHDVTPDGMTATTTTFEED